MPKNKVAGRICKICSISFTGGPQSKLCDHCRNRKKSCKTCGTDFWFYSESDYCRRKCSPDFVYNLARPEVRAAAAESNLKKYGHENPFGSKIIQKQISKTNLQRYGAENPFASEKIKSAMRIDCLDKHGVDWHSKRPEVVTRATETNLLRYGVKRPLQNKEILLKLQNTCLEKYGKSHSFNIEKTKKFYLARYGVVNNSCLSDWWEKCKATNLERYGAECWMATDEGKQNLRKVLLDRYGVTNTFLLPHAKPSPKTQSKTNVRFSTKYNITEMEFKIGQKSYDFRLGQTLLELNPTVTHNSHFSIFDKNSNGLEKNYHLDKTKLATNNGFKCIHIWDWDNQDKIIHLVNKQNYVYGRNCSTKLLSKEESNSFLENEHLQGACRGNLINIGLYHENNLISVMTFGKPRYNSNYEYELLRYASSVNVIGGAKKLWAFFLKEFSPKSVISYCDLSKFSGKTYLDLGFLLLRTSPPSKHWYNIKTKTHITDNLLRQRGYDQLHRTNFGKRTSNEKLMLENGYLPIYDCGQATYIYR